MNKEYKLKVDTQIEQFISNITFPELGDCSHETTIEKISSNSFKIKIGFTLENELAIDCWEIQISPAFFPSFHWMPHLTPTDRNIISQHCFKSPALIASDASKQLIIIPDLDLVAKSPVKWFMDMDADKNILTLGISEYMVEGHVLYTRQPGMVIPEGKLEIGFYLMLETDEGSLLNPWRNVLSFLWEKWGAALFDNGQPVNKPMLPFVEHAFEWAFNRWGNSVWQEFKLNGQVVGAPSFIVNVTQSPNYVGEVNEREIRSIWNQAWFSSLRSAQGLYRYGKRVKRKDLIEKALLTKELALSAPQRNGFFPAVICTEMTQVDIGGKLFSRSKGWETCYWGNSNRNPFSAGDIKSAPYHILDMSWTALLMLNWYTELEADERLKRYALTYAQSLLKIQRQDGFFPAWLDMEDLKPKGVLDDSPETSMSVTFLLNAYKVSGDENYLNSALKAIEAVIEHILPEGRWEDFETYWSCSSFGQKDLVGKKVKRNNMYKQCNFSMYWTAEALYYSYKITGDKKYLQWGQRCLDEMLMTQASWQPPYIYVNTLGGFGVMNCDGEWNDSRQSLFAELIINYGIELELEEYVQRGLAALKASFVMMYCPENERTKVQWEKRWPFFDKSDYGFMMENYGHDGVTNNDGLGIGEFTIYDWGNGAAAEAYMRITDHFGEKFII